MGVGRVHVGPLYWDQTSCWRPAHASHTTRHKPHALRSKRMGDGCRDMEQGRGRASWTPLHLRRKHVGDDAANRLPVTLDVVELGAD